jgi:hypothetical protein
MRWKKTSIFAAALAAGLLFSVSQASAAIFTFTTTLSGANEFPPNASTGTGSASVAWDDGTQMMAVTVNFSGLIGATTASHIHCCVSPMAATPTAGVATMVPTFSTFPLGVTSGSFTQTFDMTQASSYNPAFVTANGGTVAGAEAALLAGLHAGMAYLNIHTTVVPGGEIRGFLVEAPTAVQMRRVTAARSGKNVRLRWRTASEAGTIGFNVFRERAGARIRASQKLIPASGRVSGGSYSWLDRRPGKTSRYWLQSVGSDGSRSWYGPVRVR